MRKTIYFLLTCGLVFLFIVSSERQAYAYVDPGSGLFLLQGISSALLGVVYVVRRKLKLGGKSQPSGSTNEVAPQLESVVER